ncbi:MAG TPA: tetratricopeptide repeat protein [Brevundimonas sp.]|uniref:tetratricopeptide repeat protein n=1 Tax=Brevundimonas sp. TaxID=1871086 RepID=UPI002DEDC34E|nr:tetratricopeptide repeat protein [Brevundimonas sp.]
MTDVFEQVEEELRSERWKRLARKWGPVVGAVLALALVAALAFWGWDSFKTSQGEKAAVAYDRGMDALQANDAAAAEVAFAEAQKVGNSAYKALALNQRAGLALQRGDADQAVELLDEAARADRDPILADQAALKAVWILMDEGATLEDVEGRLEPLIREGRPQRVLALETQAMARLQFGKTAEARQTFVQLQLGQDVPDSVRQRAQIGIAAIDNGTAAAIPNVLRQPVPAAQPAPAPAGAASAPAPAASAQPAPAQR